MDFKDLSLILSGLHPDHKSSFLITNWKTDKNHSFKILKNVVKTTEDKRINPRLTGEITFKAEKGGKRGSAFLASEVICCTGGFGCTLTDNVCGVKLLLKYFKKEKKHKVAISFTSSDHGPNFRVIPSKLKLVPHIKNCIRMNDSKTIGGYGTTPAGEFLRISKENQGVKINAEFRSTLPTKKVIANLLSYERNKSKNKDEFINLKELLKQNPF